MPIPPAAFLSYVRFDDQHEEGRITQLRQRLEGEVRVHTGWREFRIFQDRTDIHWGEEWQARLDEAIQSVTFFIPILTPLYFRSDACRDELEQFLAREKALGRGDLVLPIYYVDTPLLNDPGRREQDPLAATLAARQYADWRESRFEPLTDPRLARALAGMAVQIRDALERSQPTEPRKSPSAKVEPPTHVVDAWQQGDFTTISAAIAAAKPGDRILVRPGLYQEGLIIEKPLEIIGDGAVEEIEIQAVGKDVLSFRAAMGRVAHLTLRQMGGGRWYGVDIGQGRLELEGCDISSQNSACVAIHGKADPLLRRNRIHHGAEAGVYVYENGQGVLEDNKIFGNSTWGVEIIGGNPTFLRNKIAASEYEAVSVHMSGRGTFLANDLRGNTLGAWDIESDCLPNITRKDNLE